MGAEPNVVDAITSSPSRPGSRESGVKTKKTGSVKQATSHQSYIGQLDPIVNEPSPPPPQQQKDRTMMFIGIGICCLVIVVAIIGAAVALTSQSSNETTASQATTETIGLSTDPTRPPGEFCLEINLFTGIARMNYNSGKFPLTEEQVKQLENFTFSLHFVNSPSAGAEQQRFNITWQSSMSYDPQYGNLNLTNYNYATHAIEIPVDPTIYGIGYQAIISWTGSQEYKIPPGWSGDAKPIALTPEYDHRPLTIGSYEYGWVFPEDYCRIEYQIPCLDDIPIYTPT